MESPVWHAIGVLGVIAFVLAIVAALVARRLFLSTDAKEVKRAANVLSALGGPSSAREARSEMQRRNVPQ